MNNFPVHTAFTETRTGNKVCSSASIYGTKKIKVERGIIEDDVIVRADLCKRFEIGKYVVLGKGSIIRPPFNSYVGSGGEKLTFLPLSQLFLNTENNNKKFRSPSVYLPPVYRNYIFISEDCVVQASLIESFVFIGRGCVIVSIANYRTSDFPPIFPRCFTRVPDAFSTRALKFWIILSCHQTQLWPLILCTLGIQVCLVNCLMS